MKKFYVSLSFIFIIVLSSCSLQEKMSPDIFIERLINNSEITIINEFCENEKYVCYFSDKSNSNFIIRIDSDNSRNTKKICLVCTETIKTENFKSMTETVIKIYAPNENTDEIISSLFSEEWNYFDSQWYRYSSAISENGLYFSIESAKLSTETDAEMTLKPNDISP